MDKSSVETMIFSLCTLLVYHFIIQQLLLRAGDIKPNPGPMDLDSSDNSTESQYSRYLNSGLSIVHLNIQSLKPKLDILQVELQPYDVVILTETWLSDNVKTDDLLLPNFQPPFRCDRINRIGGGVAIYVKEGLNVNLRPELSKIGLEALWVELKYNDRKCLVGGIYRPPDANNNYWQLMEECIDQAFTSNGQVVIGGDFNINMMSSDSNKLSRLIASYNAHQLIDSPTHFTEHSSSLIDLIIVRHSHNIITSFVADSFIPDLVRFHCPVVCVLKFSKPKQTCYNRRIWSYDRGNYTEYKQLLNSYDWSFIDTEETDSVADKIADNILTAAAATIPNKNVTIRPGDIPWMNNTLRQLIKQRQKLHKIAKRSNTEYAWSKFRKARNEATECLRKSKQEYNNKLIDKINSSNLSSKEWFKIAKQLTSKKSSSSIPPLIDNDQYIDDNDGKANVLNNYFCSQSTLDDSNQPPFDPIPTSNCSLTNISLSVQDVKDAVCSMDPNKASGPDLISPRLIREGIDALSVPLCNYYNRLLLNSSFPTAWKRANVTPIYKKADPSQPSNYRPVSLLSCLGKLMERCIHKHLYNYVISNNLITSFQSGFIKGDSTVNQLAFFYNDICKALDDGKEVRAVFCDISKAFDRVWHKGLIYKLSSIGIKGKLLHWFSNYLSNRKQRVVIANSTSSWKNINAGVPQGSILGPLLFLIFINDIINNINSNIRLFADDTSLYIIVDSPQISANILNSDLDKIHAWSKKWLVTFNPAKTETILFSRKRVKVNHPPLVMNNTTIPSVNSHKHLGLTFTEDTKWKDHISLTLDKAWQRIGILRTLKFIVNRSCLEKMYFCFIRPLLEYADVVWDNCSRELKNEIEAVQNEAARIVSGATKLCNIQTLLSELQWETLESRRKNHRLVLMYKMKNSLAPEYLQNTLPQMAQDRYPLRNSENTPIMTCKTKQYFDSFLPATIRDWNNLPISTRNSPTIGTFKNKLKPRKHTTPLCYNSGERKNQILHCRLRLGCSSLKNDLYRKNIVDSPLCTCGAVETISHYLLHCPNYIPQRHFYFRNLPCPITLNNLLYGDERLSPDLNIVVLQSVHAYIQSTKRFD